MEPEYEPLIGSPVDAAPESTAHLNVSPYISTGGVFLARGVATDVWLVDTPNIYDCKYVFKTVRLTLDTLKENCNPKGPRRVEQLWEDFIAAFKLKVQQWKILDHSHVVRLFGTMNSLGLCVEFCVNGTAPEYLETHSHGSSRLRKGMILDVLLGLEYIHSRTPPIVHGCLCMVRALSNHAY
ncbi:hypothetical protein RSOLAG1IB_10023 [Rhizoctonia solani AG-1 IB]|uniref:Protein kinase domain-containing protein n=1 Tax=Thanatephorus cucumeris (strain AG1-IB / isolate 7/3/14) TaxID=1108050 RepID=A0A0B7FTZ1_THACB|nr:hypothetical protein RSOLAG1IB_10023 [Rhizoctonia solani AG-1 IB]